MVRGLFGVEAEIERVRRRRAWCSTRASRPGSAAPTAALGEDVILGGSLLQRRGQVPDPDLRRPTCAQYMRLPADRRHAASRWPISCSSISARRSTGMSNWRCRPPRSSRCGSAASASSAGRVGRARTGPAPTTYRCDAAVSIRPSMLRAETARGGAARADAEGARRRWPISASKPSPASSTGSATTPSSRRCGRPRPPATAMSNWRTGCFTCCRSTAPTSISRPTISSSTGRSCSPTPPR